MFTAVISQKYKVYIVKLNTLYRHPSNLRLFCRLFQIICVMSSVFCFSSSSECLPFSSLDALITATQRYCKFNPIVFFSREIMRHVPCLVISELKKIAKRYIINMHTLSAWYILIMWIYCTLITLKYRIKNQQLKYEENLLFDLFYFLFSL